MLPSKHPREFLKRQNSLLTPSYFAHSEVSLSELQTILSIPPADRSDSDIRVLTFFTAHIKVFSELLANNDTEAHSECCRTLSYEEFNTGDVSTTQFVFHAGDEASKFYLIISGSCGVLAPVMKRGGKTEYKQLALLRQGEYFGELALINYKPRAASVICREQTHLAVLERDDYLRVLGKTHNGALQTKVNFLCQLPIFAKWNRSQVQAVSYFFRERSYKRNQSLFESGSPVSEVFVITKGEFQLCKDLRNGKCRTYHSANTPHFQLDVTVISSGELVGGEELVSGQHYPFSCICRSTKGEVLFISKEDFWARMANASTVTYLHAMSEAKAEYRSGRVEKMTEIVKQKKIVSPTERRQLFEFQKQKDTPTAFALKSELVEKKATRSLFPGLRYFDKQSMSLPPSRERVTQRLSDEQETGLNSPQKTHTKNAMSGVPRKLTESVPLAQKKSWGDIVHLKYPIERSEKHIHRKQSSVVNFHLPSHRDYSPPQASPSLPHHSPQSLSTVNLSIALFD